MTIWDDSMESEIPYYDPECGWVSKGKVISSETAGKLCRIHNIPFSPTRESDPDYWYVLFNTEIAGLCYIKNHENIVSGMHVGQVLDIERDHGNEYDSNALSINMDGHRFTRENIIRSTSTSDSPLLWNEPSSVLVETSLEDLHLF